MACGTLFPRPGSEPMAPALEVQSLNHWTIRKVPSISYCLSLNLASLMDSKWRSSVAILKFLVLNSEPDDLSHKDSLCGLYTCMSASFLCPPFTKKCLAAAQNWKLISLS